jgi:hypothetical protein
MAKQEKPCFIGHTELDECFPIWKLHKRFAPRITPTENWPISNFFVGAKIENPCVGGSIPPRATKDIPYKTPILTNRRFRFKDW